LWSVLTSEAAPPVEDLGIDKLDCEILVVDVPDGVVAALELQERLAFAFVAIDLQAGVAAVRAGVPQQIPRPAVERVPDADAAAVVGLPHAHGGIVADAVAVSAGRNAMGSGNQDGEEKRQPALG